MVKWIEEPRTVGASKSALGATVEVATSGIIPALVSVAILGLAVYGIVVLARK